MKHHFINIINNTLNDERICEYLSNLEQVKDFSYMVISNTDKPSKATYKSHVELSESIKCVGDFFTNIDKYLGSMYENILQEKNAYNGIETTSVKFYWFPDELIDFNRSGLQRDGSVIIDYSEILYDMYLIAHEITHKISFQKDNNSKINGLLSEVPSVSMELLLEDYLLNNTKYSKDDILVNRSNKLYDLYDNAIKYMYEYIVLDVNDRKGYVSKDVVEDYILREYSDISDKLLKEKYETLNYLKQYNKLKFYKRQRYILGTLFAINMSKDSNDYSELFNLISILGNTDINIKEDGEKLDSLNLRRIKDQIYIKNDLDFLKKTEKNYQEFLSDTKTKILKR